MCDKGARSWVRFLLLVERPKVWVPMESLKGSTMEGSLVIIIKKKRVFAIKGQYLPKYTNKKHILLRLILF